MKKCLYCSEEIQDEATKCKHCGELVKETPRQNITQQQVAQISTKNKKIGIFWLIFPIMSLLLIFVLYAIASFIVSSNYPDNKTISSIINIVLSFLGVISVVCIIIGIPIGIVYLNKKELIDPSGYDQRSGKGNMSEVPKEIKGWNWGAFGLNWIWGLSNNVYISLLCWIPFFGIIWTFVLGAKGNQWAWQSKQWESVEAFKASQKKWRPWGILFIILSILSAIWSYS